MFRPIVALLVAALGFAAPTAARPKDDPLDRFTFKATTTPAPGPGVRAEFRPRATERLPGNAALDYYRASLLVPEAPRNETAEEIQKRQDARVRWDEAALDAFPTDEVTAYLKRFAAGFDALDSAARREAVDWRQGAPVNPDDLTDLFQEIGKFREVGHLNVLRVRRDLARNDFDAAAVGLRSGFRFGKAVGEGPVLLQLLVGVALCEMTVGNANRFVGRPGSPNLYWALASLPRPLIDPRPALEGEAEFFDRGVRAKGFPFGEGGAGAYRAIRDDQYRAFALPYPRATAELAKVAARAEELKKAQAHPTTVMFGLTVPAVAKCYHAVARLDRRVAGLMAVEAVRLHAAGNKGVPPVGLADVTAVPVPPDPYTGRPFQYSARADGFTLTAPETDGISGSGYRYEITFRR